MIQAPQFYQNVVALNDQAHHKLRIRPAADYEFARNTNAVVIAAAEFGFAALEYPIVFLEVSGRVTPIVVLGLDPAQNLYLDADGRWSARYVPAYVRRFPFILAKANPDAEQMTVCVEEACPRLNDSEGELLFEDDGSPTDYLQKTIAFLKDYDRQARVTEEMCRRLADSTLLEPMQANLQQPDGSSRTIGGFLAVSRERLKALGPTEISALLQKDELELLFAHLLSLRNFAALADRPVPQAKTATPKAKKKATRKTRRKKS